MPFDLKTWKEKFQDRLPGWRIRFHRAGVTTAYGSVAAMSLWPVVEAFQQGDIAPLMAVLAT